MSSETSAEASALLAGNDRYQRSEAMLNMAASGDPEALTALRALLDDADNLVATTAIHACWLLGDSSVPIGRAVSSLTSSDEEEVQMAVQVLSGMGAAAIPQLTHLLADGSTPAPPILHILADIGGDAARAVIEQALQSADAETAASAREVLDDWDD